MGQRGFTRKPTIVDKAFGWLLLLPIMYAFAWGIKMIIMLWRS